MSFKFNLFPPQPQKSYYPEGQRDSTANSLFQLRETNRQTANQYQLIKDSGKQYWYGQTSIATPGGWQPSPAPRAERKNSNPQLYKRIGSSKTYNNGTGGRLQRLKTSAIAKANNTIQNLKKTGPVYHEFNITGGTITQVGNYTVHTFTTGPQEFIIPAGVPIGTFEYLVVGGGAGGASCENTATVASGGGGAGGQVLENSTSLGPSGSPYIVTVGSGGTGGPVSGPAQAGTDSTIVDDAASNIATAQGGESTLPKSTNTGSAGGSTLGFSGGNGQTSGNGGASGGGASGTIDGEDATISSAGKGGAGTSSSISGSAKGYGGGGGGGGGDFAGGAGTDGGGQGGTGIASGDDATAPGGGGGGASSQNTGVYTGGNGANGIVIIRYLSVF